MKVTATILLFYFSLLSAQPMLPLIKQAMAKDEQCTMSCCHHKNAKQGKKLPKGCCNNNMCNPFAQYSCCIGFLIEQKSISHPVSVKPDSDLVFQDNILIPNFCSDCWHPPENVA